MPQNTAITIKDGAATPLDHVFSPTSIDTSGVAKWNERASGVLVGQPTITWSVRAPSKGNPVYKMAGRLTVPKVVTTTDSSGKTVTSVDYTNLATLEFACSERSSKQERKDLRVMASNLLLNATVVAVVDDAEGIW